MSFWSAITREEAAILSVFHLMHGKILAESFQFDWKENTFYKLDKYIQPDCITTNQPSQTNYECKRSLKTVNRVCEPTEITINNRIPAHVPLHETS